ncbi:MAG TPA: hypothetical protein VHQ66_11465, partial [Myxococcota bacterium]|nr:hypothetical protein [Myxococcota bacterium]
MAVRTIRISRRKLLQIGSVAPLSALLIAGGASDEEVAALAKKLPYGTENALWLKAQHEPGVHQRNFRSAVKVLYEFFAAGAHDKNVDLPESGQAHEGLILDVAYNQENKNHEKSGVLIARRSGDWNNQMHQSIACAYLCGAEFAKTNPDFGNLEKVREKYAYAFGVVEDNM